MSAMTSRVVHAPEHAAQVPVAPKRTRHLGRWILPIWGWMVIAWLSLPIIVMIVFGFNDTQSKQNVTWNGFHAALVPRPVRRPRASDALFTSLRIAALSTAIAVVLGTLMGYALGRSKFRGSGSVTLLLFANIAAPEIVLGAALLSLFLTLNVSRGYWTIVIAHVMFSLAYVAVTVRARMAGLDPSLEEAARDLGAGPVTTFVRVTLPGILPGVLSGALLAFALSIDDYIITSFNNGNTVTFPLYVYGASRIGIPPQVNVMGTLIFMFGVLLAVERRSRVPTQIALMHPSLSDAAPVPFWLDSPDAPQPTGRLTGPTTADLVVVGGGYTGLWTALLAKEQDPSRDVVLLESRTCGWAASGRNGGFCAASLTHGAENGLSRFPDDVPALERLGRENLDAIEAAVQRYGIDCDFHRPGALDVATEPHQVEWLEESTEVLKGLGHDAVFLDESAVRAEVNSPTYLAGSWDRSDTALVDPARLAWGLRSACLSLGVRLHENTPVRSLQRDGSGVVLQCDGGSVRAAHAALATNAFPALLQRMRPFTVPVYDYALMTEPLSPDQLDAIGWRNRQGIGDVSNQFHYYRLSRDNRILWGGYDAIYHWRNGLRDELDVRPKTFDLLAQQFFETFPQLDGLRFSHAWGGAIDTSTRFFAFQRTALGGRVAYSVGYTGLGVGATRFGASAMLDLLAGRRTEATTLKAQRRRPLPFPPEPLKYLGIALTTRELARADRNGGRRGPWLKLLDRLGLGFDS